MTRPVDHIPPTIASLSDYEHLARARIDEGIWAYLNGGAGDEWTASENIAAFARLPLKSRVLQDMRTASTKTRLFGMDLAAPVLLAPVALQKLAHPDGEIATVLGAGALDTAMVVSTQASCTLEAIAAEAQAPLWFQLYIQHDRAFTARLIQRAEAAGYSALILTVDAPAGGLRNREQRAGFSLPEGIEPVHLKGLAPLPPASPETLLFGSPLMDSAPTWDDLRWLRTLTRLPLIAKGITAPEDAAKAMAIGVDGLIVSNHGGRALDGVPATIDLLPGVVDAVGGAIPVLLDGGIRRGNDVLRALALGAAAVLIGRPYIHALAVAGPPGVAHALRILRAELELAMAMTGTTDIASIDRSILWMRP